ncbi:hypothetical protein DFH07DRAFT_839779 [Mycena maculata]|uniref:Uncharacterized protein n=1 Tax=Mycena maculata TaxID=230809 RepID=A0AAD7IE50_9AGAR|nr:hypothetical protein DFH07DRAFT_839779 [Mycena maculata]
MFRPTARVGTVVVASRRRLSSSYSPKVRAYPFELSPSEALATCTAVLLGGERFKGLSRLLATLSEPIIQPESIVPVYWPSWLVDTEVEFNATIRSADGTVDQGPITVCAVNSYLPGHTMHKLSSISLLSPDLASHHPVPFSDALETQYDQKIICLPFMTTPLSILKVAKSLEPSQLIFSEGLCIDLSSIKTNLLSAYPVLIPLYLAKYAVNSGEDTDSVNQTVLIEAHSKMGEGRIIVENVSGFPSLLKGVPDRDRERVMTWQKRLATWKNALDAELKAQNPQERTDQPFLYYNAGSTSFQNIAAITMPPTWAGDIVDGFGDWLDHFLTAEALQKLTTRGGMDDLRIRPWTMEEVNIARRFMSIGIERSRAYQLIEAKSKENPTENVLQAAKKYATSLDAQREEATPSWWNEWKNSSKKKH